MRKGTKLLVFGILGLMLIGSCSFFISDQYSQNNDLEEKEFYGPVLEGYDLEYFRKNGILRENIIIKNPKTGETWNSIEEYVYRERNLKMEYEE